jgi:hypothetical protein
MRRAFRLPPSGGQALTTDDLLGDRDDLLAGKNAQQPHQGDQGRRGRAYVEQAVDHPDKNPRA